MRDYFRCLKSHKNSFFQLCFQIKNLFTFELLPVTPSASLLFPLFPLLFLNFYYLEPLVMNYHSPGYAEKNSRKM